MPIDMNNESVGGLGDVARRLPKYDGKKIHNSTLWRWCTRGVRGVRPEYVRLGVRIVTSVAAVARFAAEPINAGPNKVGELYLRYGPQAPKGGSQGDAHNGCFGQGCVDGALVAKLLTKTLGGQEHAAPDANVFAQDEDLGVASHLFPDGFPNSFDNAFNGQDYYSFALEVAL